MSKAKDKFDEDVADAEGVVGIRTGFDIGQDSKPEDSKKRKGGKVMGKEKRTMGGKEKEQLQVYRLL